MKRPNVPDEKSQSILAGLDRDAFREFPGIRSFFLSPTYDGGEVVREPGMLIIRPEANRWVWILKDPTFCTQLLVSAQTWDEVMLLAEQLLLDDRAPWVTDPWAAKKRKR